MSLKTLIGEKLNTLNEVFLATAEPDLKICSRDQKPEKEMRSSELEEARFKKD